MEIQNPILPGFNPDPAICRVGDDYYIATSTFEWFPGVQVHHSRDLANWELVARPLDRRSQLDMLGNPDSGGIWAPCLSYADGLFWLIYTDTKSWSDGPYKISPNYLVTAPAIEGPWSEPVYLNSSGFDPSLFHDEDGRKWLVNMRWDHRAGQHPFKDIVLQEYDVEGQQLVGPVHSIFTGTEIRMTEGPHLYKRNGWYYLLTAEGGTTYDHAASLARARALIGPYEVHPQNPLLTSVHDRELAIQKAGHASIVPGPGDQWILVHLGSRPLRGERCTLGRETSLQLIEWGEDDWPRLAHGGNAPAARVPLPAGLEAGPAIERSGRVSFAPGELDIHFQSLRRPFEESWLSLTARPGWLRLYGQHPTLSLFTQSLLARRTQAFHTVTSTCLEFAPEHFQHMAGLIAYYNTRRHYYLRVTHDERRGGRTLGLIRADLDVHEDLPEHEIDLPPEGPVYLQVEINREALQFRYAVEDGQWREIGPVFDATILSDDYGGMGFTGTFVGLCAQDIAGHGHPADFAWFDYQEKA